MNVEPCSSRTPRACGAPHRRLCAILLVVVGLLASTAGAAPVITLEPSRTSGIAPLAVLFDATATRDSSAARPFHTLHYEWTFGDPTSGTWAHSGQSRNRAFGPLAGHLFRTPGTYRVALTVTNSAGERTTVTRDITVQDPQNAFLAANTFCYANHASNPENWAGCPRLCPSANCINTADVNESLGPRLRRNTRHLLRRGDEFAQSAHLPPGTGGPVWIGAFGTGPKPILRSHLADAMDHAIPANTDWTVGDLSLQGDRGAPVSRAGSATPSVERFTFWDVDASGFSICAGLWGQAAFHRNLAFIDYRCTDLDAATASGWAILERSEGSMYLGLAIDAYQSPGMFRSVHMYKSLLQHSLLHGNGAISIRSCGQDNDPMCANGGVPNRYLVVSDNRIIQASGMPIRTCTHDSCDPQGTHGNQSQDILWERNFLSFDFRAPPPFVPGYFTLQGGDQTIRNNVFDLTGLPAQQDQLQVVVAGGPSPSDRGVLLRDNVHVLNNTIFSLSPLRSLTICSSMGGTGHRCRNNLLYAPQTPTRIGASGSGWTATNNQVDFAVPPFVTPYRGQNQSRVADFQLAPGASAINAGFDYRRTSGEFVQVDAFLRCRPAGSGWDVGAHEFQAAECIADRTAPAAPTLLQ